MTTPHIFELCMLLLKNENPNDHDYLYNKFTKELDQLKDINTKYGGKTLLTLASMNRNTQIIKLLLEKGADRNISTDGNLYTPLICAVYYRCFVESTNVDHIYELLKHKPKLDLQDYVGDTALMVACWGMKPEDDDIGLTLIDMGADINIDNTFHIQHQNISGCRENIPMTAFSVLCSRSSKNTPKLQKRLLSMGAHINRIKTTGAGHELFDACKNNNVYLAEELLKAGANIDHTCYIPKKDTYGRELTTTAELIIKNEQLHCLMDYLDPDNQRLIDVAIEHKCYKFIELCINKCVQQNRLDHIYSDEFINKLTIFKCDVIIKKLKRDIFSSLFLSLNRRSINKYICQQVVDFISNA
jgi:ankyrin repeat protein